MNKDSMQCLILDDDLIRHKQFRIWLDEQGIEITFVTTAKEAIEQISCTKFHCIFLDHDLGGEVYVNSTREDCGMEVVRQLHDNTLVQDKNCLFVIHTMNYPAGREMVIKLLEVKYKNVVYLSFGQMISEHGPKLNFYA